MHVWTFIFVGLLAILTSSFKLADRIVQGETGSYIVSEQDHSYSVLFLRDKTSDFLLFEEITAPTHQIELSSIDWKKWIASGAPGHSSWIQYELDANTYKLMEAYSFSRKGWLYLEESDHFLSKLLTLPLTEIPFSERKRIGPSPKEDEPDYRKVWNPPLFFEKKKIKISSDAWKTFWPSDHSILSSCQITLYFPPKELSFFPIWIEANNGHFSYSIKVIDCGKDMFCSPMKKLPHRTPKLCKHIQKNESQVEIPIKTPPYYKGFTLFAMDLSRPLVRIGPIECKLSEGKEKEEKTLTVSLDTLSKILEKNHHYKWLLLPQGPESPLIESEDFFRWGPSK